MFTIIAKVADIKTTEGNYKNQLIAKRHKRRLEKRYPETKFKIRRIDKDKKEIKDFHAIEKLSKRKEEREWE